MKPTGKIELQVPLWYTVGGSSIYVLDRTSVAAASGITVTNPSFSQTSGIYSFYYSVNSNSEITSGTQLTFTFTNFRNPVSSDPLSGFILSTEDI